MKTHPLLHFHYLKSHLINWMAQNASARSTFSAGPINCTSETHIYMLSGVSVHSSLICKCKLLYACTDVAFCWCPRCIQFWHFCAKMILKIFHYLTQCLSWKSIWVVVIFMILTSSVRWSMPAPQFSSCSMPKVSGERQTDTSPVPSLTANQIWSKAEGKKGR